MNDSNLPVKQLGIHTIFNAIVYWPVQCVTISIFKSEFVNALIVVHSRWRVPLFSKYLKSVQCEKKVFYCSAFYKSALFSYNIALTLYWKNPLYSRRDSRSSFIKILFQGSCLNAALKAWIWLMSHNIDRQRCIRRCTTKSLSRNIQKCTIVESNGIVYEVRWVFAFYYYYVYLFFCSLFLIQPKNRNSRCWMSN